MKNLLLRSFLAFGLSALPMVSMHADHHDEEAQSDLTIFVDPTIGTGGHGHVFLGANVPFGFVQLGPTEPNRGWDWCSGYHASDSILLGFAHTHLSGTGCGDLGDIRFLPVTSRDRRQYTFAHDDEECRPGYYSLLLRAGGHDTVKAELTATLRTGFHRYTFTPSDSAFVLIDMEWGTGWDRVTDCHLEQESPRRIAGWRHSSGWADRRNSSFVAEFSKDVSLEKLCHELACPRWIRQRRCLAFACQSGTLGRQHTECLGQSRFGKRVVGFRACRQRSSDSLEPTTRKDPDCDT